MHFHHRSDIYKLVDMTTVLPQMEPVVDSTIGNKDAKSSLMLIIPHVDEYYDRPETVIIHKVCVHI